MSGGGQASSWEDLRRESVNASRELRDSGRWRSALSRAYYAVFAEVARALRAAGVTMPRDWEGPAHGRMVDLITHHLHGVERLTSAEVGRLCWLITETYRLRRISDYCPSEPVGKLDVDCGLAYMTQAVAILERLH